MKFPILKAVDIKEAANNNLGNARIYLITMIYLSYSTGKWQRLIHNNS